jgi:hypothetical protein
MTNETGDWTVDSDFLVDTSNFKVSSIEFSCVPDLLTVWEN